MRWALCGVEPLVLRPSMHSRLSELREFPSSALASVVPHQPALKLRLGWQRMAFNPSSFLANDSD